MHRKTMVLGLALCTAAIAFPAVAEASWEHKGEAIQENYTVGALSLTGSATYTSGVGGITCQVSADALLEPGTTGMVSTFELDPAGAPTDRCKATGAFGGCQVHQFEPTGLPWTIHTETATTISLTTGEIHTSLTGAFCIAKQVVTTPSTLTWTVDNANAFTQVTVTGSPQVDIQTNGGTIDKVAGTASGTLKLDAPSAGTYQT